jgi:hypothetical protein
MATSTGAAGLSGACALADGDATRQELAISTQAMWRNVRWRAALSLIQLLRWDFGPLVIDMSDLLAKQTGSIDGVFAWDRYFRNTQYRKFSGGSPGQDRYAQ